MSGDVIYSPSSQDKLSEDSENIRSMVVNWRSYQQSQEQDYDSLFMTHNL